MSVKDLNKKVQNEGATPEGVLTANEYNILLSAVQEHEDKISKNTTELNNKAGKATTLSGYGIEDAYTKEEVYSKGETSEAITREVTDKTRDFYTRSEVKEMYALKKDVTTELNNKVDKVVGKGLSTNDYTNEEKEQVERVRSGSVVTDNTLSELDKTSNKPVSGKGIASAIEAASNSLKDREQLMNSNVKLIGENNTLVKAKFKGDVLEGHTIRVYVKYPNVDYTGVTYTSSSFDRFVISFRDASGALISAPVYLMCNTFEALASYYDLDVPTGTSYIIVTMRAANGFVQILTVEDITEINRLDKITREVTTDLETIREGAEKGATAVQPGNIKELLGISDWALASSKPTYTASEVGALGVSKVLNSGSLNDYKTAGIYRFNVISDASNEMTHYGNLLVVRGGDNDTLTQLYFNYNNSRAFIRSSNLGGLPSAKWNRVAFTSDIPTKLSQLTDDVVSGKYLPIDGTAVAASKLATARTIWGQSFDGTGNIDGNLTVNGGTIGYDATNKIWNLSDSLNVGKALTVHNKLTVDMSSYGNSQLEMKTNAGISTLLYVKDFDWRFCNDDWSVMHKILHSGNLKDYKLSDFTDDVVSAAVTAEVDDRMRNYMTRDELKLNYVYRNKGDIQETLGISDWALASENPSYTKAEMDTKLGLKQNTLVSSSTIKTINGESILGSGNIQINSDGSTSVVEVVLDVSKLTVGSNFKITQEQFDNIKASRFGRTVVIKESQYSDSEWGQVLSCYRLYAGSGVYAVRVSILHKDGVALSGSADNAKLYNIDIMDYSTSSYDCKVTSINNLY